MLELLSPAGSPEAVVAAVQSGADAIYMGFGKFNARREASNFTEEEFEEAVQYCRIRGCKIYATLNILINDREIGGAVNLARRAADMGVDAILVQDLGLMRVLHNAIPDLPIHASTQMGVHNLAGVLAAAEMGAKRVVLARELSMEQISYIAKNSPIETEVFVHGALCFCHSGQCYMSSLIGRRSGNRGLCAQPCRLNYSLGRGNTHPLSLKDNCLIEHLNELEEAGVSCAKIEGRMKRPEYASVVTSIYSKAIKSKQPPTREDMLKLDIAFSRQGFTDGYYTGQRGRDMCGIHTGDAEDMRRLYNTVRKSYSSGETRRVPVEFYAVFKGGERSRIAASDDRGSRALVWGPEPQLSQKTALTSESVEEQLYKTGGTPYNCTSVSAYVEPGLFLPASVLNNMRRRLLEQLTELRSEKPEPSEAGSFPTLPISIPRAEKPLVNFQVLNAQQLSRELAQLRPHCIYVPLEVLIKNFDRLRPFLDNGSIPVAVMPKVIFDTESALVRRMLSRAKLLGVRQALVGNAGQLALVREAGFGVRADYGLNIFNSYTMGVARDMGFLSAAASFELRLSQIRDMTKPIDTELIAYGRLPVMVSDQCVIKANFGRCMCDNPVQMSDRKGSIFPVAKEFGCRNVIYNAHKLFLADKKSDYSDMDLWGIRLMFTTESARECADIARSYTDGGSYRPNGVTRGLYYRGVE